MRKEYPHFKGMMPILPTLIDENGDPDLESQKKTVDYLLASGAVAIGHMGGASEYFKVSNDDRELLVRSLIEHVNKKVPVFIGTADTSLKEAVKHSQNAHRWGADLLMVSSPIAGVVRKPDLLYYYKEIGKATPLPIIIQDTGASSSHYSAEFIEEIYNCVETAGYAKAEGSGGLPKMVKLMQMFGDKMQVIGGSAGFNMLFMLRHGITAYMTGTECTDVHNDVVQAYFAGDDAKADYLYHTTVLSYLQFFSTANRFFLRYMLHRRGLVPGVHCIFPDESGKPDAVIIDELDKTLEAINRIRGKNVL